MTSLFLPLLLTPGWKSVILGPLRGEVEIEVENTGTNAVLRLLDGIILPPTGKDDKWLAASEIVTADRDRILAALYLSLYGEKVESTLTCVQCKAPFDLSFSLEDVLAHYKIPLISKKEEGIFEMDEGVKFRLPTGADEIKAFEALIDDPVDALLDQCLLEGNKSDAVKIQERMAEIAPVLNVEMETNCPECSHHQLIKFDMQTFFMSRLKKERPLLLYEIHRIAQAYHWTASEILNLPRQVRKDFVRCIESA